MRRENRLQYLLVELACINAEIFRILPLRSSSGRALSRTPCQAGSGLSCVAADESAARPPPLAGSHGMVQRSIYRQRENGKVRSRFGSIQNKNDQAGRTHVAGGLPSFFIVRNEPQLCRNRSCLRSRSPAHRRVLRLPTGNPMDCHAKADKRSLDE